MDRTKRIIEPYRHAGHKRPISRRDFLAQGFLGGVGMAIAPGMLGMLAGKAGAQSLPPAVCPGATSAGPLPFICFDLAGGASIAGSNVLVGQNGQSVPLNEQGYSKLGLPSSKRPQLLGMTDNQLGLLFHTESALLAGIVDKATPDTMTRVNGVVLCARSENDTGNNMHNPMYGVHRAGAEGDLLALIGSKSTDSGGNSLSPMFLIDPAKRLTKIDRPTDVTGLVDTGNLAIVLGDVGARRVLESVEVLSDARIANLSAETDAGLKESIRCNYRRSSYLVANFGEEELDPLQDTKIAGDGTNGEIFLTGDVEDDRSVRKTAAVMKMVCNGFAGCGTIEMGGYDYHDSTRATGERKDFEAGQMIGACLEYAAFVGKPLMLYVFSDGSVASDGKIDTDPAGNQKGIWKGDNSGTASVFILAYDPVSQPVMTSAAADHQIGYFRADGSVETDANAIANNPEMLAQAIVLNYMALIGRSSNFSSLITGETLSAAQGNLNSLIAFEQLPSIT